MAHELRIARPIGADTAAGFCNAAVLRRFNNVYRP